MLVPRTNRLLSLLSDKDYERLRPHLSLVVFDYRKSLYEASRPIEHVYFPIDGVASLVITTSDGRGGGGAASGRGGLGELPFFRADKEAPSSSSARVRAPPLHRAARL